MCPSARRWSRRCTRPKTRSSRPCGGPWSRREPDSMSIEVRLPQWGMGMHEGTVLRWFKQEGDAVQVDEDLVEIEAEKTTQSVTAPMAGVLLRQLVAEGDTVP